MSVFYLWDVLEFSDGVGIADECQTGPGRNDVRHVFIRFVSQITENGKNGYTSQETSKGIHQTDDHRVPDNRPYRVNHLNFFFELEKRSAYL